MLSIVTAARVLPPAPSLRATINECRFRVAHAAGAGTETSESFAIALGRGLAWTS